ncbi:MAG: ACP S-malonyltransferase [Hydrogenophilus sp.]|nr:ACP S-malonyltransferase [Hydrogenophilus sp.]
MRRLFVFPGQGSQQVGMMEGYEGLPEVRETFAEASEVLGEDLWRLTAEGPETVLALTRYTQPVMMTAGVAIWRAWRALGGGLPDFLAGHSLGEYSALVAAESLAFADAVRLVRLRAEAMQEAVPPGQGAMAAILGLPPDEVERVCAEVAGEEVVAAANYNSPEQTVIAGDTAAVMRAVEAAKRAGAKRAIPLPVSAPFHCPLMRPAAERLAAALAEIPIARPKVPVIHNVDVAVHDDPEEIRMALVDQAWRPVRWCETIEWAARAGVGVAVECGPGRVLAGLTRRIAPAMVSIAFADRAAVEEALRAERSAGAPSR